MLFIPPILFFHKHWNRKNRDATSLTLEVLIIDIELTVCHNRLSSKL